MTGSESFFDALKSKRESQNIEISEICEFTKINSKYIEAIELGDFTLLPNVYMRLFLKAYVNFIHTHVLSLFLIILPYPYGLSNSQVKILAFASDFI